jgi:hypothetical protein
MMQWERTGFIERSIGMSVYTGAVLVVDDARESRATIFVVSCSRRRPRCSRREEKKRSSDEVTREEEKWRAMLVTI